MKTSLPVPLAPEVIVIQGTVLDAVQPQEAPGATVSLDVPPLEPNDALVRLIGKELHGGTVSVK